MAERLPYVQQNRTIAAGGGHNAQEWRWMQAGAAGAGVCGPGHLKVTAGGGLNLSVAAGSAFIPDGAPPFAGLYHAVNDGAATLTVAAGVSQPRIDRVIAEVLDTAFGAAEDRWRLRVVAGTAAASPSPPTLPARSLSLATVAVAASASSIVAGNITDGRVPGGIWAPPQGLLARYTLPSGAQATTGTPYQVFNVQNFPLVVGRWYGFTFSGVVFFADAAGAGNIMVTKDPVTTQYQRVFQSQAIVAGNSFAIAARTIGFQATAAAMAFGATMTRSAGTGAMTLDAAFGVPTLEVHDFGGGLT